MKGKTNIYLIKLINIVIKLYINCDETMTK